MGEFCLDKLSEYFADAVPLFLSHLRETGTIVCGRFALSVVTLGYTRSADLDIVIDQRGDDFIDDFLSDTDFQLDHKDRYEDRWIKGDLTVKVIRAQKYGFGSVQAFFAALRMTYQGNLITGRRVYCLFPEPTRQRHENYELRSRFSAEVKENVIPAGFSNEGPCEIALRMRGEKFRKNFIRRYVGDTISQSWRIWWPDNKVEDDDFVEEVQRVAFGFEDDRSPFVFEVGFWERALLTL